MVAAAAIQDYGMQVEKLIMLNSAIPSEAFNPDLADASPSNGLVHDDWAGHTNACWTALWHERFPVGDARRNLTWRGRFVGVKSVAVNFYSSGDEVLELYTHCYEPSWTSDERKLWTHRRKSESRHWLKHESLVQS